MEEILSGKSSSMSLGVGRLERENKHLQQYAKRLETELAQYQAKYGIKVNLNSSNDDQALDEGSTDKINIQVLPPWITSSEIFSPLLIEYDNRIHELIDANVTAEKQLEHLTQQINRVTDENLQLRSDLQKQLDERIQTAENHPNAGIPAATGSSFGISASEAIEELNEQLEVLTRENVILSEQIAIFETEMESLTVEGNERDEQLQIISQNFQAAAVALKTLKSTVKSLRRERDITIQKVKEISKQLSNVSIEKDSAKAETNELNRENQSLRQQNKRLRNSLDDLAQRTNAETELLEQQILSFSNRSSDLQEQLELLTVNHDEIKDKYRSSKNELQSTRQDCEGMIAVIASQKKQIAEYKAKNSSVSVLVKTSKEKVEQALLEREQANARDTQSSKEVARLLELKKVSGKENLMQIKNAVNECKEQANAELEKKENEIRKLVVRCSQIQEMAERSKRDKLTAESKLNSFKHDSSLQIKTLEDSMLKLVERTEEAENNSLQMGATMQSLKEEMKEKEIELEKESAILHENMNGLQARLASCTADLSSLKNEIERLKEDKKNSETETIRLRQELSSLRLSSDSRLEMQNERSKVMKHRFETQVTEMKRNIEIKDDDLSNMRLSLERNSKHAEEELNATVAHFERFVAEQREELSRLRSRNDELNIQLQTAKNTNAENETIRQSLTAQLNEFKNQLKLAGSRSLKAKQQISELIGTEEKRVREMSELRKKLDLAELQLSRTSQQHQIDDIRR